jgi:translocator protein
MTERLRVTRYFVYYVAIVLFLSIGTATLPHLAWYESLTLPSFALPVGMMSVIWLMVFLCLAGSAAAVAAPLSSMRIVWSAFAALVPLFVLWNYTFFGMHQLVAAALVGGVIMLTLLLLLVLLRPAHPRAAALLVPVFVWMGYATFFTLALLSLNS